MEAFDDLMDHGYVVELREEIKDGPEIKSGSVVVLEYIAYVWDSAGSKAVSFDDSGSSGDLSFRVGEETDFEGKLIPLGLSQALRGLRVGSKPNITISPQWAFGEDGGYDGMVPPNTHVVYEIEVKDGKFCNITA